MDNKFRVIGILLYNDKIKELLVIVRSAGFPSNTSYNYTETFGDTYAVSIALSIWLYGLSGFVSPNNSRLSRDDNFLLRCLLTDPPNRRRTTSKTTEKTPATMARISFLFSVKKKIHDSWDTLYFSLMKSNVQFVVNMSLCKTMVLNHI